MRAVMASCAIPLVFPAVGIGGHAFVDGSVMANLPIREARALLPSRRLLLAAFDVQPPVPRFEDKLSSLELALRLLDLATRSKQYVDRELADIVLMPLNADYPWSSFSEYKNFIDLGRAYMTEERLDAFESAYAEKCLEECRKAPRIARRGSRPPRSRGHARVSISIRRPRRSRVAVPSLSERRFGRAAPSPGPRFPPQAPRSSPEPEDRLDAFLVYSEGPMKADDLLQPIQAARLDPDLAVDDHRRVEAVIREFPHDLQIDAKVIADLTQGRPLMFIPLPFTLSCLSSASSRNSFFSWTVGSSGKRIFTLRNRSPGFPGSP